MQNILDFIRRYYYIFLFVLLEGISFVLLFRFNSFQGSVWFSSANTAVAWVDKFYGDALAYANLQQVNRKLTDDNILLQRQVNSLRDALERATHQTTPTEEYVLERLDDYKLIPATVVSNSNSTKNNYLVIDKGTDSGVRPEMGVVGGGGVVGIVYLAGPRFSLVIPITNAKSSISCRVRGQKYFGYLQWDGHSIHHAYLDDIPRYAKVKNGQYIETSGYSSVFPPGLFVGRICGMSNSSDGQSYRLNVNLGTDFGNLRDVSVVATPYKAEIDTLRSHALEAQENSKE